jgi:lipoate-protein ligase A
VEKICHILQRGFENKLGIELVEGRLTGEEEALMTRLIKDKYTNNTWNMEGRGASHGY